MPSWKKVIVSGSAASLSSLQVTSVTASIVSSSQFTGSLFGTASWATNAVTSSYPIRVSGSTLYSVAPLSTNTPSIGNNIFLGDQAGNGATGVTNVVFLGNAGAGAAYSFNSNFIGAAGGGALYANDSNFFGLEAGLDTISASYSNFFGAFAGSNTQANNSNFLGESAGNSAQYANNSNFLGQQAGVGATSASYSNFFGPNAGNTAQYANNSNFLGHSAGGYATYASHSNFIGYYAGFESENASHSTLIGYKAGFKLSGFGIGSNNIIIGTNITLENNRKDSINIGGIIFGTGSYATTTGNPSSGSAGGRIGINTVTPTRNFEVSGTVAFPNLTTTNQLNVVTVDTASGQLYYTASSAFGGGSGTPGGSDTQIQYNNGGTFAGSPNFTFSGSSTVRITGSLIVSGSGTFKNIGPAEFTGSVNSLNGYTGSLFGTASWATNSLTASSADAFTVRGNLIVSGTTTIGDATTDSITMNAATMSLGSGTGVLNIDSNTLYVDGANNRVGIRKIPTTTLDISGSVFVTGSTSILVNNTDYTNTGGANSHILLSNPNASAQTSISFLNNGVVNGKIRSDYVGGMTYVSSGSANYHTFFTNGDYLVGTQRMTIWGNGNISMGNDLADQGKKLYVEGDTFISGAFDVSNTGTVPTLNLQTANSFVSQFLFATAQNGINTNGGDYTAETTGIYIISTASNNPPGNGTDFILPPVAMTGITVIVNTDTATQPIVAGAGGGNIYDRGTGNVIDLVQAGEMLFVFSDGTNYYTGYLVGI